MSYEGYEQRICELGHYISIDVYDPYDTDTCPECMSDWAWTNSVDQTNGSECTKEGGKDEDGFPIWVNCKGCEHCKNGRIDGYVEVKQVRPGIYSVPGIFEPPSKKENLTVELINQLRQEEKRIRELELTYMEVVDEDRILHLSVASAIENVQLALLRTLEIKDGTAKKVPVK